MSRVLVVANETVGSDELLAEIRRLEDETASEFFVVAPAHALSHGLGTWSQDGARSAAEERLAHTLDILRAQGFTADGQVGDMVPLNAIADALHTFKADLIVISTHPPARSGWLKKDLVESARKRFDVPVVHIISHVANAPV